MSIGWTLMIATPTAKVLKLRSGGMGIKRIAKEAGVAVGTVYRILEKAA